MFILGDFNLPNITWTSELPIMRPYSSISLEFLDLCAVFSLTQLITEPTRSTELASNTLDLVLTTRPELVSDITLSPGLSDPSLISFQANIHRPKKHNKIKIVKNHPKRTSKQLTMNLVYFLIHLWKIFMHAVCKKIGTCT